MPITLSRSSLIQYLHPKFETTGVNLQLGEEEEKTVCITDWRRGPRRAILVEISFSPRLHQETLASGYDECERLTRDDVRNEWMNPSVASLAFLLFWHCRSTVVWCFVHVCDCGAKVLCLWEWRKMREKHEFSWFGRPSVGVGLVCVCGSGTQWEWEDEWCNGHNERWVFIYKQRAESAVGF